MIQVLLPFITAIVLSAIAGYYSVVGLALIFPGSYWPIIVMGGALELSKLVTVSWLYRNWKTAPILMKSYFTVAVALLMLITSMGIFGYLSKAHIESTVSVGANTVQLKTLESQEKMTRERLEYLMKRAGDPATASKKLDKQIQETQAELTQITKDKLPLMTEENKLMADVGPIRYVAELLYDKNDAQFIDKAVRVVIFIIIFVFDPLAVLLLIAANMTLKNLQSEKTPDIIVNKNKKKKSETKPTNTIDNFFVDEHSEVIPKTQITNMTGDFK